MQQSRWWMAAVAGLIALTQANAAPPDRSARKARPKVEVVFCLDTTGSMSGLIDGAKRKIWSLCNQIAGGKPTPDLKVGLVAYRDRGDQYVTQVFDLTTDLDGLHTNLMGLRADGGGDEPESVQEALHVALNKIHWSSDTKVMRLIYLVGDAQPHIDYANDIDYETTCRKASERGIIINTIQCGNNQSTTRFWQDIARKAEGRFVQIAQDGGVQTVSTPFDTRLAEINAALAKTAVTYGDATTRATATAQLAVATAPMMPCSGGAGIAMGAGPRTTFAPVFVAPTMTWGAPGATAPASPRPIETSAPGMAGAPSVVVATSGVRMPMRFMPMPTLTTLAASTAAPAPCPATICSKSVAADRAGYVAKTGRVAALDLLQSIKEGKVKLEDLKTEELPEEMQKMSLTERRAHLKRVEVERSRLQAEALELDRKRSDHINRELRERHGDTGFDGQVMDILREQARRFGVAY